MPDGVMGVAKPLPGPSPKKGGDPEIQRHFSRMVPLPLGKGAGGEVELALN